MLSLLTVCYQHPTYTSTNVPIYDSNIHIGGSNTIIPKFTLVFGGNAGYIKQIAINKYLDGNRATLYSSETSSTLNWHIYANGFTGEDTDLVPDLCEGVEVTLTTATTYHYLTSLTTAETKLLKTCLGDSDGDSSNNVEVYNWDYGYSTGGVPVAYMLNSLQARQMYWPNPHLIKLVDLTQSSVTFSELSEVDPALYAYPKTQLCASVNDYINANYPAGWCANRDPPGFYVVVYWDSSASLFKTLTRPGFDYTTTTTFAVFTTTGYLQRVSPVVEAVTQTTDDDTQGYVRRLHSNIMYLKNASYVHNNHTSENYQGAIDCETNPVGSGYYAAACLERDDHVMFLNVGTTSTMTTTAFASNPVYPNMYKVKKIWKSAPHNSELNNQVLRHEIVLDYGTNTEYTTVVPASIYKFYPPTGFNYVGQCSNRGLCDTTTGLCNCFSGFTGDNCAMQDALAA